MAILALEQKPTFRYTSMMLTKHTAIVAAFVAVILAGIALPDATSAYTPIEDFFIDYNYSGVRAAEANKEQQDAISKARREEEQAAYFALQKPVKVDERALSRADDNDLKQNVDASPTDIINALTQLIATMGENDGTDSAEDRRNERLVERLTLHAGAPLDQQYNYGNMQYQEQRPLARTGAGTIVAMAGLFVTGLWTLKRSNRKNAVVGSIA